MPYQMQFPPTFQPGPKHYKPHFNRPDHRHDNRSDNRHMDHRSFDHRSHTTRFDFPYDSLDQNQYSQMYYPQYLPPGQEFIPHGIPSISTSSSSNSIGLDEPHRGHNSQSMSSNQLLPAFSTLDLNSDSQFGGALLGSGDGHSGAAFMPASPSATTASLAMSDSPTSTATSPANDENMKSSVGAGSSAIPSGMGPVLMGMPSPVPGTPPPVAASLATLGSSSPLMSPSSRLLLCSPQYVSCLPPIEVLRLAAQSMPICTVVIPPSPLEMLHKVRPSDGKPSRQWRGINMDNIPSYMTYSDVMHQLKLTALESAHLSTDYNSGTAKLEVRFLKYENALRFYAECLLNPVQFGDHETSVSWALVPAISDTLASSVEKGATRVINISFENNSSINSASGLSVKLQERLSKLGPIEGIQHTTKETVTTYTVCFASLDAAIRGISLARSAWPDATDIEFASEPKQSISKLEEQAALLYLGESPYETKRISKYSKIEVSEALIYQYLAAVLTAQIRGSLEQTGNRCICISRLPHNTKLLDVCNIVRGGMLESVRILDDLNVCFVNFVEPTAAARFWANYQMKRLNVNGERVRVGWGRNPGPLAPELQHVIDQGVTRNLCLKWLTKTDPFAKNGKSEADSRAEIEKVFSPFGTIEQIRIAPEVSCSFISFTDIKNTVQAVSWARESSKFSEFSVQYGKDRCATLPRSSEKTNESTLIQFLRRSLLRSLNSSNRAFGTPL